MSRDPLEKEVHVADGVIGDSREEEAKVKGR